MTARRKPLTQSQLAEIHRRIGEGEVLAAIARDFGVTRAAISFIKQQAADPERFKAKRPPKKLLSPSEMATFKHAFGHSLPADHGLEFVGHHPPAQWTLERGYALAQQLFGRKPSMRAMKECMGTHLFRQPDYGLAPPQPPGPRDVRRLPPDLAADKEFVKYYLSPIAAQIEQREYELALEQYHQKLAKARERQLAQPPDPAAPGALADDEWPDDPPAAPLAAAGFPPPPGQRVGKHAKSKGSPFTKPKRRKRPR
jgi:hypothetical protein